MVAGPGFFLSLPLFLFVTGTEALFPTGARILLALSPKGMGRGNGENIKRSPNGDKNRTWAEIRLVCGGGSQIQDSCNHGPLDVSETFSELFFPHCLQKVPTLHSDSNSLSQPWLWHSWFLPWASRTLIGPFTDISEEQNEGLVLDLTCGHSAFKPFVLLCVTLTPTE